MSVQQVPSLRDGWSACFPHEPVLLHSRRVSIHPVSLEWASLRLGPVPAVPRSGDLSQPGFCIPLPSSPHYGFAILFLSHPTLSFRSRIEPLSLLWCLAQSPAHRNPQHALLLPFIFYCNTQQDAENPRKQVQDLMQYSGVAVLTATPRPTKNSHPSVCYSGASFCALSQL